MLPGGSYFQLNPKKIFYNSDKKLNSDGEKAQALHKQLSNTDISIEVKRQARDELNQLQNKILIDKIAAPVIRTIVPILKENKGKENER